ncbi:beta strand repeat-containing protein [Microbacterium sp. NIBRBAC000506063]|uniref:beta strand repeat-containing protein n=1 Tax=Microbacterium sp. NIBRBAC000506063 TaxID=2734618 RepID=UPI001BB48EC5|nr:hypothetical protein [Microbacterium sp. NIBRBAC000506063]QTV78934.1 hypothetical protein KAE78_06945 [Microbacterium sp. NIBRBAC000506063]
MGFHGLGALVGAAAANDTFRISSGGSIGSVDGGLGGFDTLELVAAGGAITSTPSGVASGVIEFEGHTIAYAGLEPITISGDVDDVTVETTTADDEITVSQDAVTGEITVQSTLPSMESVTLVVPNSLLQILAKAPGVTVRIITDLSLFGVNLVIVAAYIVVDGVAIDLGDGDLTLAAGTEEDADASVEVTGSTISAGDIAIGATATVDVSGPADERLADENVVASAQARVTDSQLTASGDVTISSAVVANIAVTSSPTTGEDDDDTADKDVAVAYATVDTSASTLVNGATAITTPGTLTVRAHNDTTVTVLADASAADAGGAVAVADVTITASSLLTPAAGTGITAAQIDVDASSSATVAVTARASVGGATDTDAAAATRTDAATDGHTSTPNGTVSIAGAVAFLELDQSTTALLSAAEGDVITADTISVGATSAGGGIAAADGSGVADDAPGIGVAVAVTFANVVTSAAVEQATLATDQLTVRARTAPTSGADANEYLAVATSGAGSGSGGADSGSLSIAGALALAAVALTTLAGVGDIVFLVGGAGVGGSADVEASTRTASGATASPGEPAAGATTGLGTSVALTTVNNVTTAELPDGAALTGVHDLRIAADSRTAAATTATGGANGSEIALAGAFAVTVSTDRTTARIGSGGPLVATGTVIVEARQSAPVTTIARGAAESGDDAVGVVVALSFLDHAVRVQTARDVTADGAITLLADGASGATTVAEATAGGAPGEDTPGQPSASDHLEGTRDFAENAPGGSTGGAVPAQLPAPTTPRAPSRWPPRSRSRSTPRLPRHPSRT